MAFFTLELHFYLKVLYLKIRARSYGGTAAVLEEGFFTIKFQAAEFSEVLNFIDVWVEKEEGLKLVSAHLIKMG